MFMAQDRPHCAAQDSLAIADGKQDLDPATALARVCGNRELLQELAEMFLEDCPQWMAEIREQVNRRDASALRYAAHQLMGSVGNFGICTAHERARQLEAMARTGDLACAADVCCLLEEAMRRLQQVLTRLVQRSAPGRPDSPGPAETPFAEIDASRQAKA
jgi:two-component system sensor histidine kinase/response regulator